MRGTVRLSPVTRPVVVRRRMVEPLRQNVTHLATGLAVAPNVLVAEEVVCFAHGGTSVWRMK
jgi:hypothetical protein